MLWPLCNILMSLCSFVGSHFPIGVVPPRTKSPTPESSTIASYVTLRKTKKIDPRTVFKTIKLPVMLYQLGISSQGIISEQQSVASLITGHNLTIYCTITVYELLYSSVF